MLLLEKYLRHVLLYILICITQIISNFSINAQNQQYLFKTISKEQGLSNNNVTKFLRDSKGFMWFGTIDGLNRYDAYSFKIFQSDPNDSSTLQNNEITGLAEDYNGDIWIGAGAYLDIYNPITEHITHAKTIFGGKLPFEKETKWNLHKDRFGNYWYSSSKEGLYKYIVDKDSLIQVIAVKSPDGYGISRRFNSISEDSEGNIWAITFEGKILRVNNLNTNRIDTVYNIKYTTENFFNIFIDSDDDIWCYDKFYNQLGITYINQREKKIEYITDESYGFKLSSNIVTDITQDNEGKIWVITDHGGLNIIDKKNNSIQYLRSNLIDNRSIAEDALTRIYKDYEGFIWFGSFKSGVSYYHKDLYKFNYYKLMLNTNDANHLNDIDNFTEDKNGDLWIGTNGAGLVHYNRKNGATKQYVNNPKDQNSISADIIIGLTTDRNGIIWAGTYFGGLNKWDGKKFVSFKHKPSDSTSITDDRIWDIYQDSEGMLWIATLLGGVNVFDPKTEKVIKVFHGHDKTNIRSNVIFSIIEDRKGKMWFCTVDGIRSYNKKTNKFSYYEYNPDNPDGLSDNTAIDIIEDSRGLIWVGTANGLNILDESTGNFIKLFEKDGLIDNRILTILEDNLGQIWISTNEGISRIEVNYSKNNKKYNFTITNFDDLDGLQGKGFNEKAAFKTKNGELIFGGSNGFNIFNPIDIKINSIEPNIVFTDFQIFNKTYSNKNKLNGRYILTNSISFTKEITLNYSENVFSLEFSNLNYFHPERFQYKYQLEGFNDNWIETSSDKRNVTYTNLNPGKYNFHVRVTNLDGTWNEKTTSLKIIILPPWWKKFGFRVSFILGLISLIVIIYYYRTHKLRVQKHKLESTVSERTLELSKLNTVLKEQQEKISLQYKELNLHREKLEKLIKERTSELEIALKKAEDSDNLKSAFLANMSHEIRTPMNAIFGFAHLLSDTDITSEELTEYSTIIQKNCDSLLVIINDILDISKIESNQINIKKIDFDLCIMLNELINYYHLKSTERVNIIYDNPFNINSFVIKHDAVRIKQVIQNLIDNAIKFTDFGYIKFGFSIANEILSIYVEDSGKGIDRKDQEKIFIPFQKIDFYDAKTTSGVGLGLSICKKIANLMHGELFVDSRIGKGTRFTFSIPVEIISSEIENNAIIPKQETNISTSNTFHNFEVLIAEDEPNNYKYLDRILSKKKIESIWAKNGQEAVDYVTANSGKKLIILMDIKMPILNGIEAFKIIKSINEDIPIIALTAYAYEREKVEILKNDFNAYISKPFQQEELFEIIEKVTGQKIG